MSHDRHYQGPRTGENSRLIIFRIASARTPTRFTMPAGKYWVSATEVGYGRVYKVFVQCGDAAPVDFTALAANTAQQSTYGISVNCAEPGREFYVNNTNEVVITTCADPGYDGAETLVVFESIPQTTMECR